MAVVRVKLVLLLRAAVRFPELVTPWVLHLADRAKVVMPPVVSTPTTRVAESTA
jgi:hypothetical protein